MIAPFYDLKTLFLAIPWFGRVYLATEYGKNLPEKFWEEIIMNREPNRFQILILGGISQDSWPSVANERENPDNIKINQINNC